MIIDAILDHLEDIEQLDTNGNTKLTPAEIDYIKCFKFEYINNAFIKTEQKYTEFDDYQLKKAFIRYIVENDYNIEIIPRILKITWL